MNIQSCVVCAIALLAGSFAESGSVVCNADEPNHVTPDSPWNKHCRESMALYTVREPKGDKRTFQRIPHAVFQHHNPANNDRGLVYLWTTEKGVPVVIISAIVQNYRNDTLKELDEFHSLHDSALIVQRKNGKRFAPTLPGLTWQTLPNAPVPATALRQQRIQSRALSRRFRGIMKHPSLGDVRLHVIPTPLHNYNAGEGDAVRSGSLFAVCNATDPEALLMLEVRPNLAGEPVWQYACAGYTAWGTHMFYEETEVWDDDPADFSNVHKGFVVQRGFTLPEADDANAAGDDASAEADDVEGA